MYRAALRSDFHGLVKWGIYEKRILACLGCALVGLGSPPSLFAQPEEYNLVAEVVLQHPPGQPDAWQVTQFLATKSSTAFFPNARFESTEPKVLDRIAKKLVIPPSQLPLPLEDLVGTLRVLDPLHDWQPIATAGLHEGEQHMLLPYRRLDAFIIKVHALDEKSTEQEISVPLPSNPAIKVHYRPVASPVDAAWQGAVLQAADDALAVARKHGLVPLGVPGETDAMLADLRARFLIEGIAVAAPYYWVDTRENHAIALELRPVVIPGGFALELGNWAREENSELWDKPSIERLRLRRHEREGELLQKMSSLFPQGPALITQPLVEEWKNSALGKKYALVPLRYEKDTLVLYAFENVERNDYMANVGASYDNADGLQGTGTIHIIHDQAVHVDWLLEANSGAKTDSAKTALEFFVKKPMAGWKLTSNASFESSRRRQAYFADMASGSPVTWRQWNGRIGINATHGDLEPAPKNRRWPALVSVAFHLEHADDAFSGTSTALPAASELPDSSLNLKVGWQTHTLLGKQGPKLELGGNVRAVRAITTLDGNYDYWQTEGMVEAVLTIGPQAHTWKLQWLGKLGRIEGASPLGNLFRAGGDTGLIRGLHEGELIGRKYWAQSIAIGPEVGSLLGKQKAGLPPAHLLAFYDYGQVQDVTYGWHSVSGFGMALSLAGLPVGNGRVAELNLGYAYSPDSVLDRHGAFFVRLNFPFNL